jgi:hypothetical protein
MLAGIEQADFMEAWSLALVDVEPLSEPDAGGTCDILKLRVGSLAIWTTGSKLIVVLAVASINRHSYATFCGVFF